MRYIWHKMNEKPELLPRQKSVTCFVLLKDNNYITVRYWKDGDKDNIVWDSDIAHKHYVPKFLELDSSWFGDYILITVNGDGIIKNWSLAKGRISELLENKQ